MNSTESSPDASSPAEPRAGGILRALRSRNYRLFFGGQGVSLIGTWMQSVALSWLVYRLTGSGILLGVVGFAGQIPILLLGPLAGVLADRVPLRRLLVITQSLMAVQAMVLAALTLSHVITPPWIIALSLVLGLANAFDMPSRQAFVVQMIEDPADLGNAIALNSLLVNGARLVGPALAGVLIAELGEGVCFLLNGISYLAVIVALLAMRITVKPSTRKGQTVLKDLREGFAYAFNFPPIRDILGALALSSLMGMSFVTIMPVFASEVLGGGSKTLGLLLGATGLGAVGAGAALAARATVRGLGRLIVGGAAVFGAALLVEGFLRTVFLAVPLMAFVGLGMMLQIASSNTILQTVVDDDKRGRVMSLYAMSFLGMTPFGSLIVGTLTETLGVQQALRISGICCLIGAIIFALRLPTIRRFARPIYVRKGIIPSMEG